LKQSIISLLFIFLFHSIVFAEEPSEQTNRSNPFLVPAAITSVSGVVVYSLSLQMKKTADANVRNAVTPDQVQYASDQEDKANTAKTLGISAIVSGASLFLVAINYDIQIRNHRVSFDVDPQRTPLLVAHLSF
jgi:hypothetical protein